MVFWRELTCLQSVLVDDLLYIIRSYWGRHPSLLFIEDAVTVEHLAYDISKWLTHLREELPSGAQYVLSALQSGIPLLTSHPNYDKAFEGWVVPWGALLAATFSVNGELGPLLYESVQRIRIQVQRKTSCTLNLPERWQKQIRVPKYASVFCELAKRGDWETFKEQLIDRTRLTSERSAEAATFGTHEFFCKYCEFVGEFELFKHWDVILDCLLKKEESVEKTQKISYLRRLDNERLVKSMSSMRAAQCILQTNDLKLAQGVIQWPKVRRWEDHWYIVTLVSLSKQNFTMLRFLLTKFSYELPQILIGFTARHIDLLMQPEQSDLTVVKNALETRMKLTRLKTVLPKTPEGLEFCLRYAANKDEVYENWFHCPRLHNTKFESAWSAIQSLDWSKATRNLWIPRLKPKF